MPLRRCFCFGEGLAPPARVPAGRCKHWAYSSPADWLPKLAAARDQTSHSSEPSFQSFQVLFRPLYAAEQYASTTFDPPWLTCQPPVPAAKHSQPPSSRIYEAYFTEPVVRHLHQLGPASVKQLNTSLSSPQRQDAPPRAHHPRPQAPPDHPPRHPPRSTPCTWRPARDLLHGRRTLPKADRPLRQHRPERRALGPRLRHRPRGAARAVRCDDPGAAERPARAAEPELARPAHDGPWECVSVLSVPDRGMRGRERAEADVTDHFDHWGSGTWDLGLRTG